MFLMAADLEEQKQNEDPNYVSGIYRLWCVVNVFKSERTQNISL